MRQTFRILLLGMIAVAPLAACTPGTMIDAATTVAEDRSASDVGADTTIKAKLAKALVETDGAPFVALGTDVYQGRVMLTGAVKTAEARNVAVRLARNIEGVREVIDEIQVTLDGSLKNTANDALIEGKLRAKLMAEKGVASVNYRWRAVNGTVYLLGLAQSAAELAKVTDIARATEHVRKVVSHVRVK